jgi:hypothetical protein
MIDDDSPYLWFPIGFLFGVLVSWIVVVLANPGG